MNMFLHELKAYRKSTITWTFSLSLLVIFFLSVFPGFTKDALEFKKVLEGYPLGVRKALGISVDSISSLLGFYSYIFGYVVLCGSIQAMNLGISILSKEVREKTADFLLTKPVTRTEIITSKLLAAFISLLITNVIYLGVAITMAKNVTDKSFDMNIFVLISITALFTEWMFLALGVLISVAIPKIKSVLPLSLSIVFGFFIINMFSSVIGEKILRYITPFKYYDPAYIMKHSSYEATFIIIEVIFLIAVTTLSYMIYVKKDIHAV